MTYVPSSKSSMMGPHWVELFILCFKPLPDACALQSLSSRHSQGSWNPRLPHPRSWVSARSPGMKTLLKNTTSPGLSGVGSLPEISTAHLYRQWLSCCAVRSSSSSGCGRGQERTWHRRYHKPGKRWEQKRTAAQWPVTSFSWNLQFKTLGTTSPSSERSLHSTLIH